MAEYIRKQDVVKECGEWYVEEGPEEGFIGTVSQMLDMFSPADVAHVRHGKWKKIGEWGRVYRCNQCGNFLDFDGVNAGRGDANFCPNCGAKMDGKE